MTRFPRRHILAAVVVALLAGPLAARAHEAEHTLVAFTFSRDGTFVLDVTNDANWLLLRLESFVAMEGGVPRSANTGRLSDQERDTRLRALGSLFLDRIVVWVDGHEVRPESVEYVPPLGKTPADLLQPLAAYRLRGRVPPGSQSMRWYYGMVADAYPIVVARADGRTDKEMIVAGDAWSRSLDLSGQFAVPSRWALVREYLGLGYASVVPGGAGFVLFLLGLFLLRIERATILRQVVVFTAAHSAALWLAATGGMKMPAPMAGGAVALSVVYVVLENLATRQLKPWRPILIVLFGFAHGAVLASRFALVAAPPGQASLALLAFNVGAEAAAFTVLGLASIGAMAVLEN